MSSWLARVLTVVVIALPGALIEVAPAATAPPDERGVRFVRHSCPNWVWFGPRSWDAGCGVYGITVLGDDGATIDLGFSSILCSPGATYDQSAAQYFRDLRDVAARQRWRFDRTSPIVHPGGSPATYRRQTISFHTNQGPRVIGVGTFDYDFTTTVDGLSYCYQRSIARYANRRAWDGVRRRWPGRAELRLLGAGATRTELTAPAQSR